MSRETPPFPALTPAQRLHFEIYGYVVIENIMDESEVVRTYDALQNLKRRFEATGDPYSARYKGCGVGQGVCLGRTAPPFQSLPMARSTSAPTRGTRKIISRLNWKKPSDITA